MARKPQIPKRDAERALTVLKHYERGTGPSYRQPDSFGAYLLFLIALAIAGVIVYSILNHKGQISRLWYKAIHPDTIPVKVQPGQ